MDQKYKDDEIKNYIRWCNKMSKVLNKLTTINIDREVFKQLLDIKYSKNMKSMNDVLKFLLSNKKNK